MCTLYIYPLSSPTEYGVSQSTFLRKDDDSQFSAHALLYNDDDNSNDEDDDHGDSGSDGVSSLPSGSDSNHAASKLGACFCCMHKLLIKIDEWKSAFTLFVNFNC